jgi:Putative Tad-like Flp pilus-assembly
MRHALERIRAFRGERGTVAVLVGILTVTLVGLGALAIDVSHLFVVRNELQNASDSGALAGARFLYNDSGTSVNQNANQTAYNAATANLSERTPVDVHWNGGNTGDVQRGHWSFATRTFTPRDSLQPVPLWDVSEDELDRNPDFINAVRVKTRRQDRPAASFLARIFGYRNFVLSSDAVGYIGFAGTLAPFDVDQPVAICRQSLRLDEEYTCSIGRMINSGQQVARHETAGWTDFNQVNPCQGGTNANAVNSLVCGEGNPEPIVLGKPVATSGGAIANAFRNLRQCWANATGRREPWKLTLLVIDCPGNNVGPCEEAVGAVVVHIVWMSGEGEDPQYNDAPRQVGAWSSNDADGKVRWNSFVQHFKLKNLDGSPAPYDKKSIYFLPDCEPHIPTGTTGGENFGILAKIPVLVK